MRKGFNYILFTLLLVLVLAFPVLGEAAVQSQPVVVDWFQANLTLILSLALAVSELLAVTPRFKGNGILDSIIKGLKYLQAQNRRYPENDSTGDGNK